ncbi:unnamed protein product [Victoria cruziana]
MQNKENRGNEGEQQNQSSKSSEYPSFPPSFTTGRGYDAQKQPPQRFVLRSKQTQGTTGLETLSQKHQGPGSMQIDQEVEELSRLVMSFPSTKGPPFPPCINSTPVDCPPTCEQ